MVEIMKYDAIIIGAGVGGLAVDAILTLNGMKTILLEKNGAVGGRCSGFKQKLSDLDISVDYGCHVINRCQYGPVQDLLKQLGVEDEIQWFNSDKIPFVIVDKTKVISFVGVDLNQPDSIISFDKQLLIDNGLDPVNYERLYNKLLLALKGTSFNKTHNLDGTNFRKWLESKKFPPGLSDILIFLFIAGLVSSADDGSVGEYLRCIYYVIDGSVKAVQKDKRLSLGYPIGGCIKIPETIWKGIEKKGGELRLNTSVERILIEKNKVVGVSTKKGENFEAPLVISDIGIKETVLKIAGEKYFPKDYIQRVKKLKPSLGVLVWRILLDKRITDYPFVFAVQKDTEKYFKECDEGKIPDYPPMVFIPVISNMSPNLVPDGYQLILPAIIVNYEAVKDKNWEPWKKMLQDTVYTIFPDVKGHLIWNEFFNPAQAETLWGKEGGPCIGLGQSISQVGENKPDFKTSIEGLYLAGADAGKEVSGVGIELALSSGVKCGEEIIKIKNLKK